MGIKHTDVKVSGEKGYASEWNKNHVIDGNIDMVQKQFLNNVVENRTDMPAGPVAGQMIYRTDLNVLYIWDGAAWVPYTPAILKGTHYWSAPGCAFLPGDAATEVTRETNDGQMGPNVAAENIYYLPVNLPHGAVVTSAIVHGSFDVVTTWSLIRKVKDATTKVTMATANLDTADVTIGSATIDNSGYVYFFKVDTGPESIVTYESAIIIYTL